MHVPMDGCVVKLGVGGAWGDGVGNDVFVNVRIRVRPKQIYVCFLSPDRP